MQKKFGANWFLVYSRQKEGKVKTTRRSERESGMLKKTVESQQHFISLCTHLKRGGKRIRFCKVVTKKLFLDFSSSNNERV